MNPLNLETSLTLSDCSVDLCINKHPVEANAYTITAVDAKDPSNTHTHVVTLGPVSGGVTVPSQADFQKIFDDGRQIAASHVAFRAAIKTMEATLV
jgi:hypothetical protein